jgi:hypothetical protein
MKKYIKREKRFCNRAKANRNQEKIQKNQRRDQTRESGKNRLSFFIAAVKKISYSH